MLEDESGRITLVGQKLVSTHLVTGVIIAALGMETPGGEFEVVDTCFADLAPFAEQYDTTSNSMHVDRQVSYEHSQGFAFLTYQCAAILFNRTSTWPSCQDYLSEQRFKQTRKFKCWWSTCLEKWVGSKITQLRHKSRASSLQETHSWRSQTPRTEMKSSQ